MLHVIYGRDSYSIVRELLKSMKSEGDGSKIEKWILRKAFQGTGYLPEDILWRYKVQYTQGAGCESLGEKLAESVTCKL